MPNGPLKPVLRFAAWVLLAVFVLTFPAFSQDVPAVQPAYAYPQTWATALNAWRPALDDGTKVALAEYRRETVRPGDSSLRFPRTLPPSSPDTIARMEAAFSCNDTPFVDQVRLPIASLWHGRLHLTGIESDVTTANFVMGLPGAGTLGSLSLMGSGHLATRTPPSDQLLGMHLTFSLNGQTNESLDNSGLHGIERLARSGRNFLQTVFVR